jgi:hypothetical protein
LNAKTTEQNFWIPLVASFDFYYLCFYYEIKQQNKNDK